MNTVFGGVLAHEEPVCVHQLDVGGGDDSRIFVAGVLDADAGDLVKR